MIITGVAIRRATRDPRFMTEIPCGGIWLREDNRKPGDREGYFVEHTEER
jgi:hypothetical protein